MQDICGTWDKIRFKLLRWKQRLSVEKEFIIVLHAFIARDWLKMGISIKNEIFGAWFRES